MIPQSCVTNRQAQAILESAKQNQKPAVGEQKNTLLIINYAR